MARRSRQYSYNELRDLIGRSLEGCPAFGGRVEVDGKINRIAEGIWHDNYWFCIRGRDIPVVQKIQQAYILRLLEQHEDWQEGPEPHERLMRKAETLQVLKKSNFAHSTPKFICFVQDDAETIGMIETAVPGYSLDGHKDRSTLRLVGRVAADIHRLDTERFPHRPSSSRRTEHVKSRLAEFDETLFAEFPLANEVRDWITANIPSGDRSCLLHGDLLPQNLLCEWRRTSLEDTPIGVVDWEMAQVGDPAYDLAIVSRGDRKVLGAKDGLNVLVEDYLEFGGQPISLTDVRLHEFLLLLRWLEEACRENQNPVTRGHGPDFYEAKLQSLFRRAAS